MGPEAVRSDTCLDEQHCSCWTAPGPCSDKVHLCRVVQPCGLDRTLHHGPSGGGPKMLTPRPPHPAETHLTKQDTFATSPPVTRVARGARNPSLPHHLPKCGSHTVAPSLELDLNDTLRARCPQRPRPFPRRLTSMAYKSQITHNFPEMSLQRRDRYVLLRCHSDILTTPRPRTHSHHTQ